MAKVRMLEKEELKPGEAGWVQLILDKPVAVVKDDHFIIRSPMETLGGGKIIDPHAERHRRFRPAIIQSLKAREGGTAQEVIMATLEMRQPLEQAALLAQCDLPASEAQPAIERLIQQEGVIGVGKGEHRLLFTRPGWEHLAGKAVAIVQDYHQRFPVRPGMPKVELESKLKLSSTGVLQRLFKEGALIEEGASVRLPSHQIRLTQAQQARIDAFLHSLAQNPYAPSSDIIPEPDLLNLLIEQGKVVKASDSVVFAAFAYNEMVAKVIAHTKEQGKVTLAEVRDMFGTSRKYAQALLEHLDGEKVTRRIGDERVLR
jgi:selenocysteine-specific elongation factor